MRFTAGLLLSLVLGVCFGMAPASANPLKGNWVGSGVVKPKDGKAEKMRCRVRYNQESATVFSVNASCATSDLKVYQTGRILKVGNGKYVGDFYNDQWDVSGRVRVIVRGNRQSVTLTSGSGTGSLSLRKR